MIESSTNDAPPFWRDWTAWLFLIIAVLVIGLVLFCVDGASRMPGLANSAAHKAPRADVVPPVLPMALAPIAVENAKSLNARVPLVTGGFVAARPFRFTGTPDNRARARDCLAAAMLYEAGDDRTGQRSVAQVVINRARHPAFPKTICGVVFQGSERATGCQFTFTCNGALARRYSDAAWLRARGEADRMLAGEVDASVGLATHYHTDWVRPYWSDSLDKIAVVDTHLFFRWPGYWGTPAAFRNSVGGVEQSVAKMAALSPAHVDLTSLGDAGALTNAAVGETRIVVGAGTSAGRDTIFTVLDRRATAESFVTLALRLCGKRDYCKLMGWTNPMFKPDSDAMTDTSRAAMTFSYLRDEKARFEKALWNCSEYKRDDVRQCMKR